jgi:phosphate uptake regulator
MKVRIQYTVDIENIPNEVATLVEKALVQLSEASDIVGNLDTDGNISSFLEMNENARKKMLNADMLLGDCYKIIDDYAAAKHSKTNLEEQDEETEG